MRRKANEEEKKDVDVVDDEGRGEVVVDVRNEVGKEDADKYEQRSDRGIVRRVEMVIEKHREMEEKRFGC